MHLLQETLFPPPGFPPVLYLGIRNPAFPRRVQVAHDGPDGRGVVHLMEDDILTTDTYFGSFYCSYWNAYTVITSVAVTVQFHGAGLIRVFEDNGAGISLLVQHELLSDGRNPILVEFTPLNLAASPFATKIPPSRIFVEFEATRTSYLIALNFVSPQPPVHQVTLSLGLCTFNQEAYFARTAEHIATLVANEPAVSQVFVVNQGAPFKSARVAELLAGPKITTISQRNLGGCGGFTRSLREALAAEPRATHHLMMDDDIVLDERLISRAIQFLRYAERDIALGGSMLESLRPTVMYEAGAFLRSNNTIMPYCNNVDMADPGQLYHFNTPVDTDYNAWWFCVLPLEPAARAGLPAPIFIRGDDFEYGQRLAAMGVPTVTLPGVAVWHEPFYAKPPGWQDYYDLRNRLIFGATYGNKVSQLSLMHVLGLISTAVLTHQYQSAELRLKAVTDFLTGPEAMFGPDAETTHKAIMALAKLHAPEKLPQDPWASLPESPVKPKPEGLRALAAGYLKSALITIFLPATGGSAIFVDHDAHPANTAGRSYVLTNGPRTFHLMLRPRRRRTVGLLWRAVKLGRRFRRERTAIGADWAANIATYHGDAYWGRVFGDNASGDQPAPQTASAPHTAKSPQTVRAPQPPQTAANQPDQLSAGHSAGMTRS